MVLKINYIYTLHCRNIARVKSENLIISSNNFPTSSMMYDKREVV